MTRGQQAGADLAVSLRDRFAGIQGDAGVGKTTRLKPLSRFSKMPAYRSLALHQPIPP